MSRNDLFLLLICAAVAAMTVTNPTPPASRVVASLASTATATFDQARLDPH